MTANRIKTKQIKQEKTKKTENKQRKQKKQNRKQNKENKKQTNLKLADPQSPPSYVWDQKTDDSKQN